MTRASNSHVVGLWREEVSKGFFFTSFWQILPGKILATGADYLGFQFAWADYLASAIRRGRLPGPAKRWGRIPGPNFRQKAGQITWAGRLPGPRPKAGQNTCLHVFRSVATQAPNRKNPCSASFFAPRGQA